MDDSDDEIECLGDYPSTSTGTGLVTKKRRRESISKISDTIHIKEEEQQHLWKITKYQGGGIGWNAEKEVTSDEELQHMAGDEDGSVSSAGITYAKSSIAEDELDEPEPREPTILFANEDHAKATRTIVECSLGDIWECNEYKLFACDPDTATIHNYLRNGSLRILYMNKTVPQGFQGSGMFAVEVSKVIINDCEILEITKHDGNRGWSQATTTSHVVKEEDSDVHLLSQYYVHSKVKGFKKVISFVCLGPDSKDIDYNRTDVVLIRYYWTKGHGIKSFDPSEFQLPRIPTYFQKLYQTKFASTKRGKSKAPRHAYVELLESIPAAVVQFNPSFQPTGVRQAKTAKQKVKRARFGTGGIQYLLDANHVESRFFLVEKKDEFGAIVKQKRQVHFLFEDYQMHLLAKYAFGPDSVPVQLDVKFDLTDAFAVVMTLQIPGIQNKERKTPLTVFAFVAIVETKEQEVYDQCASWLKDKMEALGTITEYEGRIGNLKLITDDEPGLYNPFIKRFQACHALCYVHMKKAFERKMKQSPYSLSDELIKQWMLHIFGNPDRSQSTYQPGVVDEETADSMTAKLLEFDRKAESRNIETWLKGPSGIGKLICKMSPAVRQDMGIFPDLPHTNVVEGMNNLLGLEAGKNVLDRYELAETAVTAFRDRLEDITQSFVLRGSFELMDKKKAIPLTKYGKEKIIANHLRDFFGNDPDPSRSLSIWKAVPTAVPQAPVYDQLTTIYKDTGLPALYRSAFENANHYLRFPNKIISWPVPATSTEAQYGVISEQRGEKMYKVSIHGITGRASCECPSLKLRKDKLCKHIVAAAHRHDLLELVVCHCKSAPESALHLPKVSGAGKKGGARYSKYPTGYTNRRGLDVVQTHVVEAHPQMAQLLELERTKQRCPSPEIKCFCCGEYKGILKPWQKGSAPWLITCEKPLPENSSCPGCRERFDKNIPDLDVVITRVERDYKSGTGATEVVDARKRRYCLRLTCIRKRHPKFSPQVAKLDNLVQFSDGQLHLAAEFRSGRR